MMLARGEQNMGRTASHLLLDLENPEFIGIGMAFTDFKAIWAQVHGLRYPRTDDPEIRVMQLGLRYLGFST